MPEKKPTARELIKNLDLIIGDRQHGSFEMGVAEFRALINGVREMRDALDALTHTARASLTDSIEPPSKYKGCMCPLRPACDDADMVLYGPLKDTHDA